MAEKKRRGFTQTLLTLLAVVPNVFRLLSYSLTLIEIECKNAGRGLIKIIFIFIAFIVVLIGVWLSLLALLGFYLISLQWSYLSTLFFIFLLNLVMLLFLGLVFKNSKQDLLFPATRAHLRKIKLR